MKRNDFKHLVLTGIASGILASSTVQGANTTTSSAKKDKTLLEQMEGAKGGNIGNNEEYTEKDLLVELNSEGRAIYDKLSPEGKKLAVKVAGAYCDHQNECKGLNACKTDRNSCQGQGNCKGQGKCAISDKNVAVKLVAKKMAEKRSQTMR